MHNVIPPFFFQCLSSNTQTNNSSSTTQNAPVTGNMTNAGTTNPPTIPQYPTQTTGSQIPNPQNFQNVRNLPQNATQNIQNQAATTTFQPSQNVQYLQNASIVSGSQILPNQQICYDPLNQQYFIISNNTPSVQVTTGQTAQNPPVIVNQAIPQNQNPNNSNAYGISGQNVQSPPVFVNQQISQNQNTNQNLQGPSTNLNYLIPQKQWGQNLSAQQNYSTN